MKPNKSSFFRYAKPLVLVGLCLLSLGQVRAGAVSLQWGTATYSQAGGTPTSAINGTTTGNDAWGISQSDLSTAAETAVFETATYVGFVGGTTLTFTLRQNSSLLNNTIGCFRLSVTTDNRNEFADGFNFGGDVTANWTVLDPSSFISANGATLTKQGDLSILASGTNPATDTYTITALTSLTGITGIRLEVLEDDSLPTDGPGRASPSGNFKLTEIELTAESSAVPPIAGLMAWWPGEDAVGEIAGGAHVAVASGSQAYVSGKVGRAFSFNGTDQSANTSAPTEVMNQVPLTIEGWVKPEAHASGSINDPLPTNVISNDRVNFGGHGFGVHIYPNGSKLNIGVQGVEADFRDIPGVTFVQDEWVHVAVVYTTGQAKTYVNGQLSDTFTYTQAAIEGASVVRIGRHNDDAGFGTRRFFKGAIDELSLYNRELTTSEISSIHFAAASGKARFDGGRQFSLVSPQVANGVWTYGWLPSGAINTTNFTLHNLLSFSGSEIDRWVTSGGSTVAHNHTDNSVLRFTDNEIHYAPQQILMEPSYSGNGHRSVVRWKAPKTGRYAISATFTDIDTEATLSKAVSVYHNNVELFTGTISGFLGNGTSATHTRDLTSGDTIDFIVGEAADGFLSDSTGLVASVVELVLPLAPEIAVEQPTNTGLTDGTALINFGNQGKDYPSAAKIFTIKNTGTSLLTISDIGVGTNQETDFHVNTTGMEMSIPAGGSTTFTVVFTPGGLGTRTTILSILSDDSDEANFDFALGGTGVAPTSGEIGFASPTDEVLESGGTANITLTRTNGSDGPASVLVNSAPATAASPNDYTALSDMLVSFTSGQTTATVPVTILADALVDPDETFTLTVSSPTGGATLSTVPTTTLNIVNTLDTTPPTLIVQRAWIEKVSTKNAFKLLLDARDEKGINKVQYRFKLNSILPLPDATPWLDWLWIRGEPLITTQTCTSIVIETRTLDTAGNASPIQRRTFSSPLPVSTGPPNLFPTFLPDQPHTGAPTDFRGLFVADFNGDGRDDILQIDRLTGLVKVRRQNTDYTYSSSGFSLTANQINDSAIGDFDGDGRMDIAIAVGTTLNVYHNDGPDGTGAPQFYAMGATGLTTSGLSTVTNIAVGDVTGEGKPDIILTGTGDNGAAGSVAKIAVLVNDALSQLATSNNAIAYPSTNAGPVELGDVDGDGFMDAVMLDADNRLALLFFNKANGSFAGTNDANYALRPQTTLTGTNIAGGQTPRALTVGDVTGDGRADVVVILSKRTHVDEDGPGVDRDAQVWQLLDSRFGAFTLHANTLQGFPSVLVPAGSEPLKADVILEDLNEDGFPEIVMTQASGGIRASFFASRLDSTNTLLSFIVTDITYDNALTHPQRLAAGRPPGSAKRELLLGTGDTKQIAWVRHSYAPSIKTYDLLAGATTDSDTEGTLGANGIYSYEVDVGGVINYSLTYVNNTATTIVGGVIDCIIPPWLLLVSRDAGSVTTLKATSTYLSWTQDIPAGSSGTKHFSVRVLSGKADSLLSMDGFLRRGATQLVRTAMPKIVLIEPLDLRVAVLTDSDSGGQRAHIDETITYRMRVKNLGTGPVSGFKVGMSIPANTTLLGGTSPPVPVLTVDTGKPPVTTALNWMNLSLLSGAEITLDVRVKVKPMVANGIPIINSTVTVTRADSNKVIAPAVSTTIQPPLEITLTSNKSSVRPGELIRYTFKAKNWLNSPITNAKVVNQLPIGTTLFSAAINDNIGAPSSVGNFTYTSGFWTAAQLSPTTLPAFDRITNIMTWALGEVLPAGGERMIEFDVIVKQDIPTFANISGISTPLKVQNKTFNFAGTSSANVRLFAAKPLDAAAAAAAAAGSPASAASALLLSNLLFQPFPPLLSDPPLTPPQLSLHKSVAGDGGFITIAGEGIATVVNDSAVSTDGFVDYILEFKNEKVKVSDPTPGPGIGVVIRDYLPPGMNFTGFVDRNGVRVTSFTGYRFYTATLTPMPVIGAEGFTDTNGNGFYDTSENYIDANGITKLRPAEVYNDANKNNKYDGPIAALVRAIDFPVGDLNGGASGNFKYQAQTVALPGLVITSSAGGISGVKNGFDYTKPAGFHMVADNLHFPVSGGPAYVKVLVIGIPVLGFPFDPQKSRAEMVGVEATQIAIPFRIVGASSLTLSGVKMTLTIPKGFLVVSALLRDGTTPLPQTRAGTISRSASTGVTTVSFPINDWHYAEAVFQVQLDPLTKSALKKDGAIMSPLKIEPTLTGNYLKPAVAPKTVPTVVALKAVTPQLLATLPVRDSAITPPPPMAMHASTSIAPPPAPAPTYSDANIFVGRCAPVSVKRGDTFSYTIFVGNLTAVRLGNSIISMDIPKGTTFVSASDYRLNAQTTTGHGDYGSTLYKAVVVTSTKVSWNIGPIANSEGGAVTLTVKVRDDFPGTRIDDNSCKFDCDNARPCLKTLQVHI